MVAALAVQPEQVTRYRPEGGVRRLFFCTDNEVMLDGPAGTGKSLGALQKLHRNAIKYRGARQLIVRKTRASLTQTAMVTFEQKVLRGGPVRFHTTQQEYQYPNGSVVVVGGLDKDSKVMSSEYDTIYCQEATEITEAECEALTTRLRNGVMPYQQFIGDCNPGPPTHWINRRCNAGTMTRILSRHDENPALWDGERWTPAGAEYIARLDALTGVRYLRLRVGNWAAAEGQVYDEWNPGVHLIDAFPIPRSWSRYVAVDFGYTNPFVCQWWAMDEDERVYLYREIYMTKRIVEDHSRDILRLHGDEPYPTDVITDHDAEDRKTFEKHTGWDTRAANKAVKGGIDSVKARLRLAGDRRPRLVIMRDCRVELDQSLRDLGRPTCTAEEMETYVWDERPGAAAKEHPVKKDDHGCDAKRYLVHTLDQRGGNTPAPAAIGQVSRWQ